MQYRESQSGSFPRFQHPSTRCVYESQDHSAGRSRKESETSESSYLFTFEMIFFQVNCDIELSNEQSIFQAT